MFYVVIVANTQIYLIIRKSVPKKRKIPIFVGRWPYSLMDRISDSGSDGCGSIPHGGT